VAPNLPKEVAIVWKQAIFLCFTELKNTRASIFPFLNNLNKDNKLMTLNIKELLQNTQLQQQLKTASNLVEATRLIATAGAEKGYFLSQETVAKIVSNLMLEQHELTESDLLSVAGGRMPDCKCGLVYCSE
jgi:hypothetical protein